MSQKQLFMCDRDTQDHSLIDQRPIILSFLAINAFTISIILFKSLLTAPRTEFLLNWISLFTASLATLVLAITSVLYRRCGVRQASWDALTFGCFLYTLGEGSWLIMSLKASEPPFPSIADLFWLLGYAPFIFALYINYKMTGTSFYLFETIYISCLGLAVAGMTSYFVLAPIITSNEISMIEKLLDIAYPLMDILLVSLAFIPIILYGRRRLGISWLVIAGAFFIFAICDIIFSYMTWNELYVEGGILDYGWVLGYSLIMMGAWQKSSILASFRKSDHRQQKADSAKADKQNMAENENVRASEPETIIT